MKGIFYLIFCFLVNIGNICADDIHTVITSRGVEINHGEDCTFFSFEHDVHVISKDFDLTSDRLEVFCKKAENFLELYHPTIERIHAIGNVKFAQSSRNGHADEIILLPHEEVMHLIGHAEITDLDGTARGDKLFIDRHSNSIQINSGGRSTISVPSGGDLSDVLFKPNESKKLKTEKLDD